MEFKKLRRIVIKEELVQLTGDFKLAIVLNQMIYWSERVRDYDKFIQEEKERLNIISEGKTNLEGLELNNGWIYKKAEELAEETLINVSPKSMRRYLSDLVDKGWLDERRNPKVAMDRTLQYRVNYIKIQMDLQSLGFSLEGYPLYIEKINTKGQNDVSKRQNENTKSQNDVSSDKMTLEREKMSQQYHRLQSEITSEIINQSINQVQSTQEQNEKDDGLMNNNINIILDKIDFKNYNESTNQIIRDAIIILFNTDNLNNHDNQTIRKNLSFIDNNILQIAINNYAAATVTKTIKNHVKYLAVCIYTAILNQAIVTNLTNINQANKLKTNTLHKSTSFTNFEQRDDWDFDELERLEREFLEKKLAAQ